MHIGLRCQDASDTFLVNGNNLSMYLQKFKQKARTVQDSKIKQFSSKEELVQFYKELNSKWILKWDEVDFNYKARDLLCESITPQLYQQFIAERRKFKRAEEDELDDDKLKRKCVAVLEDKNNEIRQEFFNFYIRSQGMQSQHQKLQKIIAELGDDISESLLTEIPYIAMSYKRTSLSRLDYNQVYWKDVKVRNLIEETHKLLRTYRNRMGSIDSEYQRAIRKAETLKKPKKKGTWCRKRTFVGEDEEETKLREMSRRI